MWDSCFWENYSRTEFVNIQWCAYQNQNHPIYERPIFDLVLYNIEMPLCSGPLGSILPLTGALKWGTVWISIVTGVETMHGQIWKFGTAWKAQISFQPLFNQIQGWQGW